MDNPEHNELVTIRTQLTVALLAVTQLQRKHASSADADRLLAYVATALACITREVRKIDALMARLEDRDAMRANPVRLRARRHSSGDRERRDQSELAPHRAETREPSSSA
ncbi:MAG: hypothetical protein ACR2M3_12295 [Thermomicrobiales bacterium]